MGAGGPGWRAERHRDRRHRRDLRPGAAVLIMRRTAMRAIAILVLAVLSCGGTPAAFAPAADYAPELLGTEYGKTPLRALLHMASGVTFREDYDGNDDVARLGAALFAPDSAGPAKAVALFNTREAPPDTHFRYASVETE